MIVKASSNDADEPIIPGRESGLTRRADGNQEPAEAKDFKRDMKNESNFEEDEIFISAGRKRQIVFFIRGAFSSLLHDGCLRITNYTMIY